MAARRTSVLLVEDEILISKLIAEVLSESGFAVHAVEDGEEALRYLESGPMWTCCLPTSISSGAWMARC
jgi:DNA-binding response OmpR family regulator